MPRPTNRAVAERIVAAIRSRVQGVSTYGQLRLSVTSYRWDLYYNGSGECPRWYVAWCTSHGSIVDVEPPPLHTSPTAENYRHARIGLLVAEMLGNGVCMVREFPDRLPAYGGSRTERGPWVYTPSARLPDDA